MKENITIVEVETTLDLKKCWQVVKILRPSFTEEKFLSYIIDMKKEGYKIIAAQIKTTFVGYAGYRPMTTLHSGKIFYLDDLVTSTHSRNMGIGTMLLDYIKKEAISKSKDAVTLDSSYDLTPAHRLYLNNSYSIVAHHFSLSI